MKYFIILFSIALVAGYSYYQSSRLGDMTSDSEEELVLKELPGVSLDKLMEGGLQSEDLHLYIDKMDVSALVVHFWGTWCGPCEAEFPALVKLAKKFENNKSVNFLFVAVDDDERKVRKFIKRFKGAYPGIQVFLDNQKVYRDKFGTTRVPETYVFNKFKKTIRKFSGAMEWEQDFFYNLLESYATK